MQVGDLSGNRSEPDTVQVVGNIPHLIHKLKTGLKSQLLVALLLVAVLLLVSPVAATSALLGSLAVYLPGFMFSVLVLRKLGGDSAAFLKTAMLAEIGKLLMMGLLCAVVFIWMEPLAPGYFFLGMIVTLATGWAGLVVAFQDNEKTLRKP